MVLIETAALMYVRYNIRSTWLNVLPIGAQKPSAVEQPVLSLDGRLPYIKSLKRVM